MAMTRNDCQCARYFISSHELLDRPNLLCKVVRVESLGNKEIQIFSQTPFRPADMHFVYGQNPHILTTFNFDQI